MRTSLEPSNITGSPYIYLTFFLTEKLFNGPHIVVSDGRELDPGVGIIVGYYRHQRDYDHPREPLPEMFTTLQEALVRVKELADGN